MRNEIMVRFDVVTAFVVNASIFLDITPYSPLKVR
jgi:hypothetical protein